MKPAIKILIALVGGLLVVGLGAAGITKVRREADRMTCTNNLKQFGIALHNHHDVYNCLPPGTVAAPDLPPDKRLGWLVQIYPIYLEGGYKLLLDQTKAWDDPDNCPVRYLGKLDDQVRLFGEVRLFYCPGNPRRGYPGLPSITHYVAVAGVGADAADLPLTDPRAGMFGNDRKVKLNSLPHYETTLLILEAPDGGPWTAGGQATLRGLIPDAAPYLDEGGQFAGNHPRGWPASRRPLGTNALFVDGSVRCLSPAMAPRVLEALATIAVQESLFEYRE
jgi:hypothetical protein